MKTKTTFATGLLLAALSVSLPGFAQDTAKKAPAKKEAPAPTAEQRQKMAAVHQQMADCLKSDKPMSECRDTMRKSCSDMMDKEGCGMGMMGGGGGMGMGMGGMMGGHERKGKAKKDEHHEEESKE